MCKAARLAAALQGEARMSFRKLLIANRGEIALRISRAASELGVASVAVFSADDAQSAHARGGDEAIELPGAGPAAYLSIAAILAAAKQAGCDAVHPGYGFLSENAGFARAAAAAGLVFVGPSPETLEAFGDKAAARALARDCDAPVPEGSNRAVTLAEAASFLAGQQGGAILVKAVAGGGGRGLRFVSRPEELEAAFARCRSEAEAAFGDGALYVERYLSDARHIEIQIVGDGLAVVALGERECTIQRQRQKLIETAPSRSLSEPMREKLVTAALKLARRVRFSGLGTFEFLVFNRGADFAFLEANPRLQVEHTVTEEVYGVDLVKTQIRLAAGQSLAELGLDRTPTPRGAAMQFRINLETLTPDGSAKPTGGTLTRFTPPTGPGLRVDAYGYEGYRTNPRYDSLIAKLVVASPEGAADALARARRALAEFAIEGVETNLPILRAIADHPDFAADRITTDFVEAHIGELLAATEPASKPRMRDLRGVDPLGVFQAGVPRERAVAAIPDGLVAAPAPLQGTIVAWLVAKGQNLRIGEPLVVVEAMKMEHLVAAPTAGIVAQLLVDVGDTIFEGEPLLLIAPAEGEAADAAVASSVDLDAIRGDLAEALARHAALLDENRPEAVARRRKTGQRTARENVADLCDPCSFVEYGGLAVAAQRQRRDIEELRRISPADGMIAGVGAVNGDLFGPERSRAAVLAYDYTVFAGTQGLLNHKKKDRLLTLADRWSLPVVLFAEGGGGRPGDEWPTPAGLEAPTFTRFAGLNGRVPLIGIVSGRCFAGNAALLGSCDVIIADRSANIGMGGPAMVEGGGLGVFRPEDIGPASVQAPNGVIDVLVDDESEGVAVAKTYLAFFQGRTNEWSAADQRLLRHAVPENRLRAYDIRPLIDTLADTGSVLELRRDFGRGMITALARIEGRPVGLIANNSHHLGGAIDADGGDKAARFLQLCDAFGLPIVSLCDTPGMMVGPEIEKAAQVRHVSRMFVAGAHVRAPWFTVVLRKGYGLGALAMAGGASHASFFIVGWPSAEFGAMGLEGSVKLAYRKELAAIEDAAQRKAWFDDRVARLYEDNKALSSATYLEIDDVIDPSETRRWLVHGLNSARAQGAPARPRVDVW
jgi:acetyl/propionyl-CoA carboxylase alpha subunit